MAGGGGGCIYRGWPVLGVNWQQSKTAQLPSERVWAVLLFVFSRFGQPPDRTCLQPYPHLPPPFSHGQYYLPIWRSFLSPYTFAPNTYSAGDICKHNNTERPVFIMVYGERLIFHIDANSAFCWECVPAFKDPQDRFLRMGCFCGWRGRQVPPRQRAAKSPWPSMESPQVNFWFRPCVSAHPGVVLPACLDLQ